jgi:hypothetical protein
MINRTRAFLLYTVAIERLSVVLASISSIGGTLGEKGFNENIVVQLDFVKGGSTKTPPFLPLLC